VHAKAATTAPSPLRSPRILSCTPGPRSSHKHGHRRRFSCTQSSRPSTYYVNPSVIGSTHASWAEQWGPIKMDGIPCGTTRDSWATTFHQTISMSLVLHITASIFAPAPVVHEVDPPDVGGSISPSHVGPRVIIVDVRVLDKHFLRHTGRHEGPRGIRGVRAW
jgi:hypothetical protein